MFVSAPNVMLSSTCYDLRDLRSTLQTFIEQLGFIPLMSELHSFPIDPDRTTIENCKRRVEEHADVLILVIGGRYGYADAASAKSVTNLEYLTARRKRIPIFAFVRSEVLHALPLWKANRTGDFSGVVDDVRLFEFIERVRSADSVWVWDFKTPQDIIPALKSQFAHQMKEGLDWRRRVLASDQLQLEGFSGAALRLALETPQFWEFRLFFELLRDQVDSRKQLARQHELGLRTGVAEQVPVSSLPAWFGARMRELINYTESMNVLCGEALRGAWGAPGVAGNAQEIRFVVAQIGNVYEQVILWCQRVRHVATDDDELREALDDVARLPTKVLDSIKTLVSDGSTYLESRLAEIEAGSEDKALVFTIVMELHDNHEEVTQRLLHVLQRLAHEE